MKNAVTFLTVALAGVGVSGSAYADCWIVWSGLSSHIECDPVDDGGSCLAVDTVYTATIENTTNSDINFQIACGDNDYFNYSIASEDAKSYTCEAGSTCDNTIPIFINFDSSFGSGLQNKTYSLETAWYYFRDTDDGIDLFTD